MSGLRELLEHLKTRAESNHHVMAPWRWDGDVGGPYVISSCTQCNAKVRYVPHLELGLGEALSTECLSAPYLPAAPLPNLVYCGGYVPLSETRER